MSHVKKPAATSPERVALAEAIAKRDERRAHIAATAAAIGNAEAAWRDAGLRRSAAEAGVASAKAEAVERLTAGQPGAATAAASTVKAARSAMTEADDDLEAAAAALDALRRRSDDLAQFSYLPEQRVAEAVSTVVRNSPAVAALVAEVAELQRKLADKGAALLFLAGNLDMANNPDGTTNATKLALTRCQTPMTTWKALLSAGAVAPWSEALAALAVDATAPLPG